MTSIYAKKVYTGSEILADAHVNFDGARIASVGTEAEGNVVAEFDVITPAFIDPHSHIGMVRSGEPGSEAEANEHLESIIAHGDALDSVNMDDFAFRDSLEAGVLYSCVVPGSGNIVGGRSAFVRNYGSSTSEALITRAGIKGAFGYNPMSTRDWQGKRPYTRMGALALLRERLHGVALKMRKEESLRRKASGEDGADILDKLPDYSYEDEILKDLLTRSQRFRVHAHRTDDIDALLRLADEFSLAVTVEHTCDVYREETYRELAKRKIPVVFGPLDSFAYKVELKHENWRNLRHLISSGVDYGLMTDHPVILQRNLPLCLRWFTRCGLSKQEAIEIICRRNAEVIGVSRTLGTLERGKWASFCGWNGDPFDLTSYVVTAYGEGRLVYQDGEGVE
jgi:imidazolonepropionase-like amidohydrolase